jgi:hypothetical protein
MFVIGSRVIDRTPYFMTGDIVPGTVVGIETVCRTSGAHSVLVDWDAASWSEYRGAEVRWCDELMFATV